MRSLPLVVIAGPTASGKTSLAIELAKKYGGEIICADSRTVYKGMDIGTAKPSVAERAGVPHWGIDIVEPGDAFSVVDFKRYAEAKIEEVRARGHVPFLVGGTGLYIDAVVYDYQFTESEVDHERRAELMQRSIEELHEYCRNNNIELPENSLNKRYVVRAIEQNGVNHKRQSAPIDDSIIVGIATDTADLRTKIERRFEQMLAYGVVEEAMILGKKYGWDSEAMTGNIYPLLRQHLEEGLPMSEVKDKFTTLDWRLAKRQRTWLRRNTHMHWGTVKEVQAYVEARLVS